MEKLLFLLLNHIGTMTTIMKLVQQGIEIAPEIIAGAKKQFDTITKFWKEDRPPTEAEMAEIIAQRKALEDAILEVQP